MKSVNKGFLCKVDDCGRDAVIKLMCRKHYARNNLYGSPTAPRQKRVYKTSPDERFWAKVDKSGGEEACWLWTGSASPLGYGKFSGGVGNSNQQAHRRSWAVARGFEYKQISPNFVVDHLCHNPPCVNPRHLRLTSRSLNSANRNPDTAQGVAGYLNVFPVNTKYRYRIMFSGKAYIGPSRDTPLEAYEESLQVKKELGILL